MTRDGTTTTLTYNDANQPTGESYAGGTLNGLSVTPVYDAHLRRETLSVGTTPSLNFSYGYDTASRLLTVADGLNPATANSATYSYVPNSQLAGTIQFKQAGSLRMTTTRQYDKLNRLFSIASVGTLATATRKGSDNMKGIRVKGSKELTFSHNEKYPNPKIVLRRHRLSQALQRCPRAR